MENASIAVCTTTLYPQWFAGSADIADLLESGDRMRAESKIRGDLALRTLEQLVREQYRLILVDSSSTAFRSALRERHIPFEAARERGFSPERRQAFSSAYAVGDSEACVWMEPEKIDLIRSLPLCAEPVLQHEAAVVIPARAQGWKNYPSYQAASEKKGNAHYNRLLRRAGILSETQPDLDMFFGPRVYSARRTYRDRILAALLQCYRFSEKTNINDMKLPPYRKNPGIYSETGFFPVVSALEEKFPVVSVPVPFSYPDEQRQLEEHPSFVPAYRAKRAFQWQGIVVDQAYYLNEVGRLGKEPQHRIHKQKG